MRQKPIIIGVIVLLALLIVINWPSFSSKASFSRSVATVFESLTPEGELQRQISLLKKENTDLRAQLTMVKALPEDKIAVYSSYPFNTRSEIVINAGASRGVITGQPILVGNAVLVGRVESVSSNTSIVRTIFDPGFEIAVRIGDAAADGLMRGGNELVVELIPGEAEISVGDSIYTASELFPYGLSIGTVKEIQADEGEVFKTARVEPAFEIKSLRYVDLPN